MKSVTGGVTAAKGFNACGVAAGIKPSKKLDLALIVTDHPARAAGVLTTNRVKAASVLISQARLRRGRASAILINSGCANCLTGDAGRQDALRLTRAVARRLRIPENDVLVASTGLIGKRLPVERVLRAVPSLVKHVSRANHADAAQAILTTDLRIKEAAVETMIGGHRCRVGGMAKGAGMIAPSMATMLCVVTTDVVIAPALLRTLLRQATARTFNRITVDGDMSTNDTVFALASGDAGAVIRSTGTSARLFARTLETVMERLATLIVQDGEGVTRTMRVHVDGARTDRDAQACARQIANSPLVKTMLAGSDPNPGRIAAAAGASTARFDAARLEIAIGSHTIVANGMARLNNVAMLRRLLSRPAVTVRVNLHAGRGSGWMLASDLTEDYVRINAGYAT
ncbi:MAG: bifunctional glutamate N-acetyltransferase/amino-acid acetyltransferase ArgJ [Candidatus Omnitrophica bacterium]|nr:bifunctional glutamate N-acetyltransferase/amino-acid acetyltransferase ArgJ [Candidatus Omnitrophota bacterium]